MVSSRGFVVAAVLVCSVVTLAAAVQWIEPEYTTAAVEMTAGVEAELDTRPNEKNMKRGRAQQVNSFKKPPPGSGGKKKQQKQSGGKQQKQTSPKPAKAKGPTPQPAGSKKTERQAARPPKAPKPAKAKAAQPPAAQPPAAQPPAAQPPAAQPPAVIPPAIPPVAQRNNYPQQPNQAQQDKTTASADRLALAQKDAREALERKHQGRIGRRTPHFNNRMSIMSAKRDLASPETAPGDHARARGELAQAKHNQRQVKADLRDRSWAEYKRKMPGVIQDTNQPMSVRQAKDRLKLMQSGDPTALNGLTKNRGKNHAKVSGPGGSKANQRKVINTPYAGRDAAGQDAAHQKAWNRSTKREYGLVVSPDGREAVIVKGQAGSVPSDSRAGFAQPVHTHPLSIDPATGRPGDIQRRHIPSGSDITTTNKMIREEKPTDRINSQSVYSAMKDAGTGQPALNSIGHEVDAPTYPLHHDQRANVNSKLTNIRDTGVPHATVDRNGVTHTIHNSDLKISNTPGTFHISNKPDGGHLPDTNGHTP